ncbi:hypothetical protein IGI47_001109 [Enterococcus sp. AZ191]|uniref:hypothetical protein n=1 Tax=Enterococcus sp. AZ191 TaxID=2774639 RepID=UPI003F1ECB11
MKDHQQSTKIFWVVLSNGVITLVEFIGVFFSGRLSLTFDAFVIFEIHQQLCYLTIAQKIASKQRNP